MMKQKGKHVKIKENGRMKLYERVKSRIHHNIYYLKEIDLYCNETMPTEEELDEWLSMK